jgi:hypothetical protein
MAAGELSVVMRRFLRRFQEKIVKHTSQEPLLGKGSSRMRFQVLLKLQRFVFIGKGAVPD